MSGAQVTPQVTREAPRGSRSRAGARASGHALSDAPLRACALAFATLGFVTFVVAHAAAADTRAACAPDADTFRALEGKGILAVSVETEGHRWPEKPSLRSVAIGSPLTPQAAERAMLELEATGRFVKVCAEPRAFEDGVILRLVAVPRRIASQVNVVATGPLSESRVKGALGLAVFGDVTESSLRLARSRLIALYEDAGYDRARVSLTVTDTDDPLRVVVTVTVDAGVPRRIARRIFVLEPKYERAVGDLKDRYRVAVGDVVAKDALAEADAELTELLRKRHFVEARVEHRVVLGAAGSFLFIEIASGPRYEVRFRNHRAFDERELAAALGLDTSAEPTLGALSERLTAFYVARGYLDARTDSSDALREGESVRELTFTVSEGEPVRVRERLFPCLDERPDEGLDASALGRELDAFLEGELPTEPFLSTVRETVVDDAFGSGGGLRAPQTSREAAATFSAEAYKAALAHLDRLLESKGYRHAAIGPLSLVRAECDPLATGRGCVSRAVRPLPSPRCLRGARDLPEPEEPLLESFTCVPDAAKSRHCSPDVKLWLPVQLGPKTELYDVAFEGLALFTPGEALALTGLVVGTPYAALATEAAGTRLLDAYADAGYAFARVRPEVQESPDKTRARVRFVITESDPVTISGYDVRGALRTEPSVVLGRLALCQNLRACRGSERYFKRNLARESEQQIATLGLFSSVSVSLEQPEVPAREKRVIVSVVEQPSQFLEPRGGFSTGEGFRIAAEYGHRSVGGRAIGLTLRIEFGYLPDFLILEDAVRVRYAAFVGDLGKRLERRNGVTLAFPEIGLGAKVSFSVDGVDIRDNQRDYGLSREAIIPILSYRPTRTVSATLGASVEANTVTLFEEGGLSAAIKRNPTLANLLRVPEGRTLAIAQRASVTWDRRDDPFAATRGTLLATTVEHVTALPLDELTTTNSEFLRLNARGAGYVRLTPGGLALAVSLAGGYNLQLASGSETYPDRLFYAGGVSTVRGFDYDSMVPEDVAREVLAGRLAIDEVVVRGGDVFINPRIELRIPATERVSVGLFLDTGNVWSKGDSIGTFTDLLDLRYAAGSGLRANTPIGPIALDGGIKLVRRPWEDIGAVHFSIGLF